MKKLKNLYEEVSSENTSAFLKELRSQAERLVKPQAMASLKNLSMDDIARLVHELETHQIELEMQYNELKLVQDELEEINYEYTRLYDDAPVGLVSIDQKGKILKTNVSARHMLNIPPSNASTSLMTSFIVEEDQDVFYLNKQQALTSLNRESCELRLKTNTGEPLWVRLDSICDLDTKRVECIRIRLVLIDISEQKRAKADLLLEQKKTDDSKDIISELNIKLGTQSEQKEHVDKKLKNMDAHDQLTNLPNRAFINEEAYRTISQAQKQGDLVGLMIISVDDLVLMNYDDGDLLGDVIVVEAAIMIRDSLREGDMVGRWGSSKFLVILRQPESIETLQEMANKILGKAAAPKLSMVVKELKLSIGLALFPNHAETATNIISHAENAMFKAIEAGGNQYASSD